MKKKGDSLEIFVEHLFKDLGKRRVRRNRTYKKKGYRAQIDVVFGLCRPTFVECKHYASHVPYSEFMKFVGVCNQLKPSKRVMVTTSDFEGRCYHDSHKYGITLINGPQLHKLHRKTKFLKPKKTLNQLVKDHGKYPYKQSLKRKTINYSKYGLLFAVGVVAYEHKDQWLPFIENLF